MRALFTKDIVILMFFLASGLTAFTFMAFDVGFDRAFVIPQGRLLGDLIGGWIGWAVLFGWAIGATDQIRGVSGYISHRGFSRARLFWTQQALCMTVILVVLFTPWIILAAVQSSPFEPEYVQVGKRWVLAGSIMFPCFAVGVFLAKLPVHFSIRLFLTIPMLLWIVGPRPEISILEPSFFSPGKFAMVRLSLAGVLLLAALMASSSQVDRDLPAARQSILPAVLVLIGVGWSIQALVANGTLETVRRVDRSRIALRADGSYSLGRSHFDSTSRELQRWEVDPATHRRTVRNKELVFVPSAKQTATGPFRSASFIRSTTRCSGTARARQIESYLRFDRGEILHLVRLKDSGGRSIHLDRTGHTFSPGTKLYNRRKIDKSTLLWAGDTADGTIWVLDLRKEHWGYAQVSLPDGDRFVDWLSLNSESRKFMAGRLNPAGADVSKIDSLVFMKTTQGWAFVDEAAMKVHPIAQEIVDAANEDEGRSQAAVVHVTQPGFLFHEHQVLDPAGRTLFTSTFAPRTERELGVLAFAGLLSLFRAPILEPVAFGNVTQMRDNIRYYPDFTSPQEPEPTRLMPMHAMVLSRIQWTGFSPWSLIAWALLACLAFLARQRLVKIGATGPRLWLWPLAILAFGPLAWILRLAMEPKRAFYAPKRVAKDKAPQLLIHSS